MVSLIRFIFTVLPGCLIQGDLADELCDDAMHYRAVASSEQLLATKNGNAYGVDIRIGDPAHIPSHTRTSVRRFGHCTQQAVYCEGQPALYDEACCLLPPISPAANMYEDDFTGFLDLSLRHIHGRLVWAVA